jgi:hypothetical protein
VDEVDWRTVPNLALWGDNPIDLESAREYFDSPALQRLPVVGLNTSAFIEAGIVGSPVLAILPRSFDRIRKERCTFVTSWTADY